MPPKVKKAKKLTPKQMIAKLEADLATLQTEKVSREKALLDTNFSLVNTVQQLRDLCQRQQNEFNAQHEVVLTALQAELDASKGKVAELTSRCTHLSALEASTRSMHEERLNLLRQLGEVTSSRERSERAHAEEMSLMQGTMDSTKARLERVFNETLRTAVADEKKRLAIQLDAEATAALGEVGQLRMLSSNQSKQIAQLLRAVEDAHAETDRAGEEIGRLTRQLVNIGYRLEEVKVVEERERLAQAEALRWREICVQLHEEVSTLREKLGMLPPRPLPRIQQARRASMSRRASSGQAMTIAKLLVAVQAVADEATEAVVSAGHMRPSTATRQRLRPESDPAAAAALRAADRAQDKGIAADVDNPLPARLEYDVEDDDEGQEGDKEEEEEGGRAHSASPSQPQMQREAEEKKEAEEEDGGLWTASRVSRSRQSASSRPITAAAASSSSGTFSGPVGAGFLSYERARAKGEGVGAGGGAGQHKSSARPASAGIIMHSPLVTPPAAKALTLVDSHAGSAALVTTTTSSPPARPASAAPHMAAGAIAVSAARPQSAVPPPSRLFSPVDRPGSPSSPSPVPRLPLAPPVTHSTAVEHVRDDMAADSARRAHAIGRGYSVEGAPAVILSAPTAAGLGFTRPGTAGSPPSSAKRPMSAATGRRSPSPTAAADSNQSARSPTANTGLAKGVLFGNTVRFRPSSSPVPVVPSGTAIAPVRRGSVIVDTRGTGKVGEATGQGHSPPSLRPGSARPFFTSYTQGVMPLPVSHGQGGIGLVTSPVKAPPGTAPAGKRRDDVATIEASAAAAAAAAAALYAQQPPTARTRAAEGAVGSIPLIDSQAGHGQAKGVLFGNTVRFRPASSPVPVVPRGTAIGPVRRGSVLIDGKGTSVSQKAGGQAETGSDRAALTTRRGCS